MKSLLLNEIKLQVIPKQDEIDISTHDDLALSDGKPNLQPGKKWIEVDCKIKFLSSGDFSNITELDILQALQNVNGTISLD